MLNTFHVESQRLFEYRESALKTQIAETAHTPNWTKVPIGTDVRGSCEVTG